MKTVVFAAAPYCYGPTAKAICVAEELVGECEKVYVGMEPGLTLAADSVFSEVIEITDRDRWNTESLRVLANADLLVSALDYRALPLAATHGIRSVFLDTLFWLRDEVPPHTELAQVYLAQRFFERSNCNEWKLGGKPIEIGPILPKQFDEWRLPRVTTGPLDVVVNFGGLQSPAMRPGADRDYILLTASILEAALPSTCRVRLALPRYLRFDRGFDSHISKRFEIEYPTQSEFHRLLEQAGLLVTTPGLETVYEATAAGVPIVFLPPYNATQLLQNRVYVRNGMALHHVGLPYEQFDVITASTLNFVTSAIHEQNARHSLNPRLLWQAGKQLAHCLNTSFGNPRVILSKMSHNQLLLRSLEPHGRKAAAEAIRIQLGNTCPAFAT